MRNVKAHAHHAGLTMCRNHIGQIVMRMIVPTYEYVAIGLQDVASADLLEGP